METIVKIDVKKMKADIKAKVELQKFYKDQRKSVYNKGSREITPKDAQYRHTANRGDLRILYAAYGVARGKTFQQIENISTWEKQSYDETHPLQRFQKSIDRILDGYKYLVEVPVEAIEQ